MVVLVFSQKRKVKELMIPLLCCIISFFVAAVVFFLMTLGFHEDAETSKSIFAVWWITMLLEVMILVAVSCKWRMLSFKATHLAERMGLLTLIVIGEGAIGVTKTVSKIMGESGPDLKSALLICCIILLLVSSLQPSVQKRIMRKTDVILVFLLDVLL
jgi:low temperature requirement protein LtrA